MAYLVEDHESPMVPVGETRTLRVVPQPPAALQFFDRTHLPSAARQTRQRVLDLVLGSVLAAIALPILLLAACACALILRSTPLFVASRPGRGEHQLRVIKLRTLPRSYPSVALKPELAGYRVPVFCGWLRRHHLDELPQLFEVIWGRMSLVGPRPRQNHEVDALHPDFDHLRREVRQGCTGLWQISVAATGSLSDAAEYDLFYLQHMSIRLDLWILVRTIGQLLGIGKPIELEDVPGWALRRAAWTVTAYPTTEPLALPAVATADDVAL